jgi:phytoene dehydrogenase-like protein
LPSGERIKALRYDAAIIGAGANGLTAAAVLARAGLKIVVIERGPVAGGRLVTDAFHPGFSASAFADRAPEIPAEVSAALALDAPLLIETLPQDVRQRRDAALAEIFAQARQPHRHDWLARFRRALVRDESAPIWPGQDLVSRSLADWPRLRSWALIGRAIDPDLAGSALSLLALAGAEPVTGGLGALGGAFLRAAAGAELRLGQEASEIATARGRVTGLLLADGSRIAADAVISTLDLKHSLLSLFPWTALTPALRHKAAHFRMPGGTARLLLALKRPSNAAAPLLLAGDAQFLSSFRHGAVPSQPPLLIDPVSLRDPSLAPPGGATLTVTIAGIPGRLFDGAWSPYRRQRLAASILPRIEAVLPGTLAALGGIRIILAPDMEARLGASGGDLDGGQFSADQMLAFRPGARAVMAGFYLGGASAAAGPLGTGAAGYAAALALLADRS